MTMSGDSTPTTAPATPYELPTKLSSRPKIPEVITSTETVDIEHVTVDDDPREWSQTRKVYSFYSRLFVLKAHLH